MGAPKRAAPRRVAVTPLNHLIEPRDTAYHYRYVPRRLPLESIIVLPQPRRTFEYIPELATDIAERGLLHPLTVAAFDRKSFARYLDALNDLWSTNFEVSEFHPSRQRRKPTYYVLLAGERRFRAHRWLWERGCATCEEKHGPQSRAGACFRRHFPDHRLTAQLCENIPPLAALCLQLAENTHNPVPEHEEARAYSLLYGAILRADPSYSVAAFARRVGRSATTVQRALRYCNLPVAVQEYVEKGYLRYGHAIEIARLMREKATERELLFWRDWAVAHRVGVEDFRRLISKNIGVLRSGQISLLQIMGVIQEEDRRRAAVRKAVAEGTIQALYAWTSYLTTILEMLRDGRLGREDSPFSSRSPCKALEKLAHLLTLILEHLTAPVGRETRKRLTELAPQVLIALAGIEDLLPPVS